jgi:signal transduction histidine kinase
MKQPILKMLINDEPDVVLVRQRARQLAEQFGFDLIDQTRFATAVSELARNAFQYAAGGKAEFIYDDAQPALMVQVSDEGRGIEHLDQIMQGQYRSATGMGVGLIGAKRLNDIFEVKSTPVGASVLIGKKLPDNKPLSSERLAKAAQQLMTQPVAASPIIDARLRNLELVQTLDTLQMRQQEIERLNRELEETNRGVLALYSELDEKAESLKQASELKSRFLSQMSHELRTPLNSIVMLSRLMLSGVDGPLPTETEKQAGFIQQAADGLLELINDLLDLAKIESGRVDVTPREVSLSATWGALRGMFRPLIGDLPVELLFAEAEGLPTLFTDEVKLSQVLRNLISNAVKFTARGYVRVSAEVVDREAMLFKVTDTGIGIPAEHQGSLFTEFVQLSEAAGYKQKGTGLGLALCRRLVEMLGGTIWCESVLGEGSTFAFRIPVKYSEPITRPDDYLRAVL